MEQKSNISASDLFSPILNAYKAYLIFYICTFYEAFCTCHLFIFGT